MKVIHYPFPPPGEAPAAADREPYPVPLHTSDMEPKDQVPAPVAGLKAYAEACGWRVSAPRQAIGFLPHATHGTPGDEPKVSWSLRMMRGSRMAVAVRMGSSWSSFWAWSDQEFFRRCGTLAEFREALK